MAESTGTTKFGQVITIQSSTLTQAECDSILAHQISQAEMGPVTVNDADKIKILVQEAVAESLAAQGVAVKAPAPLA